MTARKLAVALAALATLLGSGVGGPARAADTRTGAVQPTPRDPQAAAEAGRQAGPPGGGVAGPALAGEDLGTAPPPAPSGAGASNPRAFATYRVYATQYNPNTPGSVEVAVPDKCAKFAALKNQTVLNQFGCSSGYRLDLDYRVVVTRDSGQTATFPVKDVGPWNIDDNYWAAPGSSRPRRLYGDLPRGTPESQAAFYNGYNTVPDCVSLSTGQPSGKPDGADQFGRCVLNPAGIDLSMEAAKQLGMGNGWVTVSFLWEPAVVGATYQPVNPARVLDTRNGTGTGGATNPLGQGATVELKVTDAGGVPAGGVTAVALNVTATGATGPGSFLTVYPSGSPRPLASNLNFNPGRSIPNLVIARVGSGGRVSIYNNLGSVHVVADVQGYYVAGQPAASTYKPVQPLRVMDTRTGTGVAPAKVPAGGTVELKVTEVGGVPASGVTAVVLNMTTTGATGPESFLTVWPSGQPRPGVSNLNFTAGPPSTNAVVARVGEGGRISVYNNLGSTDVVADLNGWFAAPGSAGPGQLYHSLDPIRTLDTRNGTGTPGGAAGALGAGATIDLVVAGVAGVPAAATAVVLNVTAADSPGPESYLTLFPSGVPRPLASNLNFVARQTVANLAMVQIGNGRVSVYNNLGSVAVIGDVQGFYATD